MPKLLKALAGSVLMLSLASGPLFAATVSANMNVKLVIISECKITTPTDLDFGSRGVIDSNIDQTSTITVVCTTGTTYNVGLSAGAGTGATVATRKLTSGSSTVNYMIYRDAARTLNWGNTVGTDTFASTGTGASQTITAYGRVPPQTTPAVGTYTDTVAVTVTY